MEPTLAEPLVDETFFAPALRLLRDYCRHRRDTPQLSDEQFLRGGLQRVLGQCDSGRRATKIILPRIILPTKFGEEPFLAKNLQPAVSATAKPEAL